ncbi:ephexin isoform 2-T2 [Glossina fuscipes fuscipes]
MRTTVISTEAMTVMDTMELLDAAMPISEDKQVKKNLKTFTTNANATTSCTKAKTILNWLKNNTTTNVTKTVDNSVTVTATRTTNNHNRFDTLEKQQSSLSDECTCLTLKTLNDTFANNNKNNNNNSNSNNKNNKPLTSFLNYNTDEAFRDFRGVQTLRRLWNKRITANKESSSTLCIKAGKDSDHNFTKSVNCLTNTANTGEQPPVSSRKEKLTCGLSTSTHRNRAQSLHDCSLLYSRESIDYSLLTNLEFQIHLEKDNFYKYKTAEQATKLRELCENTKPRRKSSVGIVTKEGVFYPSTKQEHLSSLQKHGSCAKTSIAISQSTMAIRDCNRGNASICFDDSVNLIVLTAARKNERDKVDSNKMKQTSTTTTQLPTAEGQNDTVSNYSTTTSTLEIINSTACVSQCRVTNKESAKALCAVSNCRDSNSLPAASPVSRSNTKRSSSVATRKYSFRTHSRSFHHNTSRKMHPSKDITPSLVCNQFSLVAKLTQQFNEIIQKDRTLLTEVKRKNGILMTRGGHVYKVLESPALTGKTFSPNISRSSSRSRDKHLERVNSKSSTVQKTIKKFENGRVSNADNTKPKVPTKSLQVLKKSKEIVLSKRAAVTYRMPVNRTLLLSKEAEIKIDARNTSPLEIVKEETKIVLENHGQPSELKDQVNELISEKKTANMVNQKQNDGYIYIGNEENRKERKYDNVLKTDEEDEQCEEEYTLHREREEKQVQKELHSELMRTSSVGDSKLKNEIEKHLAKNGIPLSADIAAKKDDSQTKTTALEDERELKIEEREQQKKAEIVKCERTAANYNIMHRDETKRCETLTESKDEEDSLSEEKLKQRKHKYAKIYEKFRFRSPFSNKKTISAGKSKLEINDSPKMPENISDENVNETFSDDVKNSDSKSFYALEMVDQKLKNLKLDNKVQYPEMILDENNEFQQVSLPNQSFVFQTSTKEANDKSLVTQAVNVALVNSLQKCLVLKDKQLKGNVQEESLYEFIGSQPKQDLKSEEKKEKEENIYSKRSSFLYKTCNVLAMSERRSLIAKDDAEREQEEEDIYQSLEDVKVQKTIGQTLVEETSQMVNSQNIDDYEIIENLGIRKIDDKEKSKQFFVFDGYEECFPPLADDNNKSNVTNLGVRNTNDELPEIPKPKKRYSKSPLPCRRTSKTPCLPSADDHSHYADDENIYDTIKGSDCYESLHSINNKLHSQTYEPKGADTISLTSNCYESITQYRRNANITTATNSSSNSSTLSISSEHKTNSLYEDFATSGTLLGYTGTSSRRIYRLGTRSDLEVGKMSTGGNIRYAATQSVGSDNSDDWIDITDNENTDGEQKLSQNKLQYIVVRERSKTHKSPDWSKRVRDKRLNHQRKFEKFNEEDSDHYYEKLSPQVLTKRHSMQLQVSNATIGSLQRNEILVSQHGKKFSYSAQTLGQNITDDYDSFDTDVEEIYLRENLKNSHNDSGVDVNNMKLPDPPSNTNQMYAIVKRFKNFIVNKKSLNGSKQKIYDNSTQFYVNTNYSASNAPTKCISDHSAIESKSLALTKELSTSEKNLLVAQSIVTTTESHNTATTPRAKVKTNKSLRSRIRKSLVGFDNKQPLATLTPTRSTFYIEDPSNLEDHPGEMDSGFSEKASSGDLPTNLLDTKTPILRAEGVRICTTNRKAKKEAKLAICNRRRTTIGIRPHEPPPPPPDNSCRSSPPTVNATSWYAECGVFKNGKTTNLGRDNPHANSNNPLSLSTSGSTIACGSSWYEEAGLYQTSGLSVASSSGSSGVSTGNEAAPNDDMSYSMFSNEPLYQIYSAAKLEAISRDMEQEQDNSSTDGYEEIGDQRHTSPRKSLESERKFNRPTALQLVEPKCGPARTLWCEIPEVIKSCILTTLTARERALMEAKFEIITSEASYLKSLSLLRTHYINHPVFRDTNILNSRDRKSLFAHIVPVHECSEKLLTELESCWQDNIMLGGLSKHIYAIAEKHFHVYIIFCENQGRMDRTLKCLREAKGLFSQNLDLLESNPTSCGLSLHSFLMLPMQRITRLPLLIDAVFSKCHPNDDEYESWKMCLAIMNKVVAQCNDAANRCEQAYELEKISRQLEFNAVLIRPLAIAPAGVAAPGSKPRYLVKKGELTQLIWRGDEAKLTFGKKFTKSNVYAFLFSDLLVLTKRKGEENFSVFDYCPRSMLTIASGDSLPQLPTKDLNSQSSKNLILMTLLENHERKTVELILSCPSVSEQERWLQAMRPPEAETPGEKLYEQWDCPQVITKHPYEAHEPDVLNLELGDVVNVTRKLPDGWYHGERIRDGAIGWFPGSYTEEVNSAHVRARNLKQRHRLLTFTATYLESQKRQK